MFPGLSWKLSCHKPFFLYKYFQGAFSQGRRGWVKTKPPFPSIVSPLSISFQLHFQPHPDHLSLILDCDPEKMPLEKMSRKTQWKHKRIHGWLRSRPSLLHGMQANFLWGLAVSSQAQIPFNKKENILVPLHMMKAHLRTNLNELWLET